MRSFLVQGCGWLSLQASPLRPCFLLAGLSLATFAGHPVAFSEEPQAKAEPLAKAKPVGPEVAQPGLGQSGTPILEVGDVRRGMRGIGKTVLAGTEIVTFQAEILGVQRNVAPGRDLILARLAGANLDETGVIAGMSGSPVYIDGKLLGAVAYAWPFAKEPVAGITPFRQMEAASQRPAATAVARLPLERGGSMPVAQLDWTANALQTIATMNTGGRRTDDPEPVQTSVGPMRPIAIPLSAAGFGSRQLQALQRFLEPQGLTMMAAGGAAADVTEQDAQVRIEPGSALACSLVTGDMDLSGIGTTTHVEGDLVWGWGHPMLSSGRCQYLMRTGFIHLVNNKLDISTKMGVPLAVEGIIHADVGPCVAGRLGQTPDLLPVKVTIRKPDQNWEQDYHAQVVRQPELLAPLVASVLGSSLEELGELPTEMTVRLTAEVKARDLDPIVVNDTFSGPFLNDAGSVSDLMSNLAVVVHGLTVNPFGSARIEEVNCTTEILTGRQSAEIDHGWLDQRQYQPGEVATATVRLRPHKGDTVREQIRLTIPPHLKPGKYTLRVCDANTHLRELLSEQPQLTEARSVGDVARAYQCQLATANDHLYARLNLPDRGLTSDGTTLRRLPTTVRRVLAGSAGSPAEAVKEALVEKKATNWILHGSLYLDLVVAEGSPYTTLVNDSKE